MTFSSSKLALLGDSITFNNRIAPGTTQCTNSKGYATWLNILSGQRFNCPFSNNFGVSGDNLSQMSSRVSNVIASGSTVCIVLGGTNDLTQGNNFSAMQGTMLNGILLPLVNASIQVIVLPILPRAGLTTQQALIGQNFNSWLRELCLGTGYLSTQSNINPQNWPILVDPTEYLQDATSPIGASLPHYTFDGLHPASMGAYWIGYALFQTLTALYPPRPTKQIAVMDYYDAVNNPYGNLLATPGSNSGLLFGTSGINLTTTGLTPTGSVATSWRQFRGIGTGTGTTLVGSKENPRQDIVNRQANGERQKQVITLGGTGGESDETYSLGLTKAISTGLSAGDTVFGEICFEVQGTPFNLTGIEFNISENGPAHPQLYIANMLQTGDPANFTWAFKGTLRTPPMTLQSG